MPLAFMQEDFLGFSILCGVSEILAKCRVDPSKGCSHRQSCVGPVKGLFTPNDSITVIVMLKGTTFDLFDVMFVMMTVTESLGADGP